MLSGRTRHDLLLRGQRLSSHPHAGDPRLSLSPRVPIPPTASLCPRLRGCSRTARSTAPRAYDTCQHFSPPSHNPHSSPHLAPCALAHALHIPSPRQDHPPTFFHRRTQHLPFTGSSSRARSRARLLEHNASAFGLRMAVSKQAYMRVVTADMLRDATTATTVTLATRHDATGRRSL
jgi:hypothetical protein